MIEAVIPPRRPPDPAPYPYPYPPMPDIPRRTEPVHVPIVDAPPPPGASPADRLFDRRTILVGGVLDHDAVTELCARLMALDGRSAAPVELLVNSDGGPVTAIGAVLDVLDLLRAAVNTTCTGSARGTACVLVACGTGTRRAGRHAVLSLRLPADPGDGLGDDLAGRVEEQATVRRQVAAALVRATGQPAEWVAEALDRGDLLDAEAAVAAGLVDEVVVPAVR
jgi:ATP-dependent Clp protease, protease subunit